MAFSVSYIYQILDKYSAPLRKITNQTNRFQKSAKGASQRLGKFSGKMLSAQTAVTSFAGVLGGANVLGTFLDFEKAINKLGSVTLESDAVMAKFRETAKDLGMTTQFSAGQAAQGMTFLAMAGLNTDQILKAIPETLKLAAAGGLDLATAADIATNVMAQMGFSSQELVRINDVLALSQSKANLNITEMFDAMRPAAVTAKNLGLTLEQTASVLGVMANAGEKGSIAGTLFRNMLTNMVGPSQKQAKLYKRLKINMREFVDETGNIKNFTGFISKLEGLKKQGRLSIPVMQALFGDRGFRAAQILIGAGGDELARFNKLLEGAAGTADKASAAMMRGLPGVVLAMASAFEAFKIGLIESGIDKILIGIFQKVTGILREFASASPGVLKIVGLIGLIAIAAAPAMIAIGMIASGMAAVAGMAAFISAPVVGVFAAIAAVIIGAWTQSEKFREGVTRLAVAFGPLFTALGNVLGLMGEIVAWVASDTFRFIGDVIGTFANILGAGLEVANVGMAALFGSTPATDSGMMNGNISGNIEVSATGGARVNKASLNTDLPGNIGMTLAGA